ncbi:MAG: tryptophan synthase subunit alpha [Pseudomonadota bacterium]
MTVINRIDQCIQARLNVRQKVLIPFITTGDPGLEETLTLMHALVEGGADILELGVPFSDPMADGPIIQRASDRAVKRGVGLSDVFNTVKKFREHNQHTAVVLMGYANPIEAMGVTTFVTQAKNVGVDGVLVVDYPPEEVEELSQTMANENIYPIFLLAPTTSSKRVQSVAQHAKGYVYYVSLNGVTGAGHLDTKQVKTRIHTLREHISIPIGVGFGIRDAETAVTLAETADAVVIGSRLVQLIEETPPEQLESTLRTWIHEVRKALDTHYHA